MSSVRGWAHAIQKFTAFAGALHNSAPVEFFHVSVVRHLIRYSASAGKSRQNLYGIWNGEFNLKFERMRRKEKKTHSHDLIA